MKKVSLVIVVLCILLGLSAPLMAQDTNPATLALSPVILVPFDREGFDDSLAGISLSIHPFTPKPTDEPFIAWLKKNGTIEIPCVGASWDEMKAGLGGAINLTSQENISLKLGLAYVQEVHKPAVMIGISIPIR